MWGQEDSPVPGALCPPKLWGVCLLAATYAFGINKVNEQCMTVVDGYLNTINLCQVMYITHVYLRVYFR